MQQPKLNVLQDEESKNIHLNRFIINTFRNIDK